MVSDERREIAASLRESRDYISGLPKVSLEQKSFDTFERILKCIDYERGNIFDYLADLIDPTCHIVLRQSDSDFTDEPHYMCSNCGKEGIDVFERRDYTLDGIMSHAPYCKMCGARVVDE